MTKALVDVFSDFQPYEEEYKGVVPHPTVAHGGPFEAAAVEAFGAVKAGCASVMLIENSTGRWKELHVFHLSPADA